MIKQVSSAAVLVIAASILAGCSSSSAGSSNNESAVSQEAATATASEAAAMATSMTETQTSTSSGAMAAHTDVSGCPSVDVKSTGSNNQWTDELLTFDAPPCQFTGVRGYNTLAITGTLELTRSAGDAYNFASDANSLAWTFTSANATYSETRTGTRSITASSSAASVANDMTVVFAGAAHNGTLVNQLAAAFTPASGMSLAAGEPLPSGNFSLSGSTQWTGSDGNDGTFSVTTATPLVYDSTCKDTEPSVFDSGELHVHLTTDNGKAYAKIAWQNCGAPSVSFVAE